MLLCFFEKIVLGVFSFIGVRDLARFSHVPGGDIRVEERAFTFEEAVDNSMDIIKRQLEKAKAKFEK